MKPEGADKVPIDCDFSAAGLFDVQDFIKRKLDPKYKMWDKFCFILKVPSQTFQEALTLSYVSKYDIKIDFEYKWDEWSLTGKIWFTDEPTKQMKPYATKICDKCYTVEYTIWSPGA